MIDLLTLLVKDYLIDVVSFISGVLLISGWFFRLTGLDVSKTIVVFKTAIITVGQLTTWVISEILAVVGFLLQLGFFSGSTIYSSLITGFVLSLAANGVFSVELVKEILRALGSLSKPQVNKLKSVK